MGLNIQDLKLGLSEAKSEMALAESEFKKRTAGLDAWEDSVEGLAEKLVALGSKIETQKGLVEAYGNEWQRVVDQYGEGSKKANEALTKYNNAQTTLEKMQKEYETFADTLSDIAENGDLASKGADSLQGSIERLNKHISDQKDTIARTEQQLESVKGEYGEDSQEAEKLTKKLETQKDQLETLESALEVYQGALDDSETEARETGNEFDSLTGSIKDADAAADGANTGGFANLKSGLEGFRDKVLSKMTDVVKDLATSTFNLGIDFTGTMSNIQATSGATAEEMEVLEQAARDAGATTTFSATEAAQAIGFMSLAGWDAEQSTTALGGVLDLAAASGMDLAKASDMVTDYMSAFGLEADQSGKFADTLAYAQSHANTTAEQLGEAYKNSAATLHANGQSVETVTALLSAMANQGIKGSEAGTALSAVMRDITQKMEDGSIAIGDANVSVVDADGNFRSLTDILADVEKETQGMTDAQRATALQTTFTSDSMKALNMILGQGTGSIKAFEGELANSDGTAKQMAETMNDNLGGDIKKLQSAFEELQLKLFDLLEGPLRGIVGFITDNLPLVITLVAGVGAAFAAWKVASVLGEMSSAIKNIIPILTTLTSTTALSTAGEIAHTAATTAMTAAQGLATAATTALSGAMAFLAANPIVLVVAAIAGLIAALVWLWDNCEEFRQAVEAIWDAIVGFFTWAYDEIVKVWNGIVDFFGGVWEGIQGAFDGVGDFFSDVGETAASFFEDPWGTTQKFFQDTVSTVKNCFVGVAEFFGINGEDAAKAFEKAWETVKGFFDSIVKGIETVFNGIVSFFSDLGANAVKFFEDPWGSITSFFGGIWSSIQGAFSGVGDFFGNVFGGAVKGIQDAFNGIKSFFEGIFNSIVGIFQPILSFFGINIGTKNDPKAQLKNQIADAKKQVESLTTKQSLDASDWSNASRTYGYGSWQETNARNVYSKTSSDLTNAKTNLAKLEKQLSDMEGQSSGGMGSAAQDLGKSIFDGLSKGLSGIGDLITKPFTDAWNSITGIFSGVGDWFNKNVMKPVGDAVKGITDTVGDITGGITEGISKGASDVVGGVQKFGEDVYNGFCSFFGIRSPSRLMRDKVGKMLALGVGQGIDIGTSDVIDSIRNLSTDASDALSISGGTGLGNTTVVYNQTINSPEPLTAGQIYRDTRSLIGRRTWA